MERISWNHYFMAQSHVLAMRSTCTRLMVGATIVRDKRIIAGGYNGSVSGSAHCSDDGCYVVDNHCIRTIHAEMNALLQCAKFGVPTEGAEVYVTHFPCVHCTKALIQAGIKHIYYAEDYKNHPYALNILKETNVGYTKVIHDPALFDQHFGEKQALTAELLNKLKESGLSENELKPFHEQAEKLFVTRPSSK